MSSKNALFFGTIPIAFAITGEEKKAIEEGFAKKQEQFTSLVEHEIFAEEIENNIWNLHMVHTLLKDQFVENQLEFALIKPL